MRRTRQHFGHLDGDAIAVDDNRASRDGEIIGKNFDHVILATFKLDYGTASKPQDLVDGHGCRAENNGDVEADFFDACQGGSFRLFFYYNAVHTDRDMVTKWLTHANTAQDYSL